MRQTLLLLFCGYFSLLRGQAGERSIYGGLLYKNSGIGLAYQNRLDPGKGPVKQFDIEFATYHHPRETKSFNSELNNPTPFVFGKLNKAALLKVNYSRYYKISGFTDAQRVGIDLGVGGGLVIGFLKPVYINLIYPDPLGYETVVAEKYDPQKHTDKSRIAGYTDGRVGWSEISSRVGLSLSAGIGFTWGYFTNYPKRLETGFYLEYFKSGLPIMAFTPNKPVREGVFVKLFFGKRTLKN